MKEPKLQHRPEYPLLRQSDIVSFFHMQMPRWLFYDPKYIHLSIEAKVAYTFLLNRFQLSKMNGWQNSEGEVFIIFTRENLAEEMHVSYRKAIACFKELLAADLIWEYRPGRGNANHIYLAAVELSEDNAASHQSAPFGSRSAETAGLEDIACDVNGTECEAGADQKWIAPLQGMPNPQGKTCKNGRSACADMALLDMQNRHTSKKESNKKDLSDKEKVSQSVSARAREAPVLSYGQTGGDKSELNDILEYCEMDVLLPEEEAGVFRNAITRLYYSECFRMGNAQLPGSVVRSHLSKLDGLVILDTREKLRRNLDKNVKNSTAYVMAALFNNITEITSDLMVDPYLNSM